MSLIYYQIQKLAPQRIMVKTTWRSGHAWSAIFSVIVYCSIYMFFSKGKCSLHCDMKVMSCDKINLTRSKNCWLTWCLNLLHDIHGTTSFECLRHIHLSLRQGTTYPSMTSKSYSLFWTKLEMIFSIHSLPTRTLKISQKNYKISADITTLLFTKIWGIFTPSPKCWK